MINGNASNDFEFDTLTNPRLLRGKKEQLETPPSDLEVKIEEGREFFHQKHTYKFKEQILYNTLSSKYFKDSNFDLANLAYYQNYFRPTEDFVSRNRNLIQNLRTEYINGGYLKKEKENEEEDANKKSKLEKLNNQEKKDDVVTFEELGVDKLFVDEAHNYKNLFLISIESPYYNSAIIILSMESVSYIII